jgi:hypothetical protein
MPWREATSLPLTRIAIVAQVPSESGVYGVFRGDECVLVGSTWNLKAHLLELITAIDATDELSVKYELVPEEKAAERSAALNRELKSTHHPVMPPNGKGRPQGITFWDTSVAGDPSSAHDA